MGLSVLYLVCLWLCVLCVVGCMDVVCLFYVGLHFVRRVIVCFSAVISVICWFCACGREVVCVCEVLFRNLFCCVPCANVLMCFF